MDRAKYLTSTATLKADGGAGLVQAVFSTFGVLDRDGEVVTHEALKAVEGVEVPMVWHHSWHEPVGKGRISVDAKAATFTGSFFLSTTAGREAYERVKAMGDLQQWSWGFRPTGVDLRDFHTPDGEVIREVPHITGVEIFEVSPVLVGSNPETRTVSVKGGLACAACGTPVLVKQDETPEQVIEGWAETLGVDGVIDLFESWKAERLDDDDEDALAALAAAEIEIAEADLVLGGA